MKASRGYLICLGLTVLMGLLSLVRSPTVESGPQPPEDPLALAAQVGLNQVWYVQRGYDRPTASLPPIAPAHFAPRAAPPSPTASLPSMAPTDSAPPARATTASTLEPRAYLPVVERGWLEARALWVTRWDYSTVADVQTLVDNAAGAGFNLLLFQVRGTADAFYTPGIEPWGARLSGGTLGQDPGWDPLRTAVEAAHARGLQVHAYVNVYTTWVGESAPPEGTVPVHLFWILSHRYDWDDWRAWTSGGPMLLNPSYLWATPALDDVVDQAVAVTADLVTRYDVDGVHLDLVRYPGPGYSYDPFTQAALSQTGLPRADWQRQRVSYLVGRVYSEVITLRPDLRLSAAVWPVYKNYWGWVGYSQGYHDYYQDSQGWMLSGIVDAIMPMIYPPDVFTPDQFSVLVADFMAHAGGRHVFPGISAQNGDFAEVAQRIAIARQQGAPGHAIFSARLVAANDFWDEFAAGPYALPANVPPVTWHP
jgi:uncharacterized lipoprotein YddW (UPF0748 family)